MSVAADATGQWSGSRNWFVDWECRYCRTFGNITVKITGGPKDEVTGKLNPKTTDEEFYKSLWQAHHDATRGICSHRLTLKNTASPYLWRWERNNDGTKQMVVMDSRGGPPPAVYKWPRWSQ